MNTTKTKNAIVAFIKANSPPIVIFSAAVGAAITLAAGCSLFGANPKAPTAAERAIYDLSTNQVPQVLTITNVVTKTNVVNVPVPSITPGLPPTLVLETNVVSTTNTFNVTNQVDGYTLTTKPSVKAEVQTVGAVANTFSAGLGTIGAGAVSLLLGAWGWLRSQKMTTTSTALTQEIEAVRDFILTLPQGTKIDAAVTQFMQQHQTEAGVAQTVLKLIDGNTDNPTVIGVSSQLQQAINELTNPPAATGAVPKA